MRRTTELFFVAAAFFLWVASMFYSHVYGWWAVLAVFLTGAVIIIGTALYTAEKEPEPMTQQDFEQQQTVHQGDEPYIAHIHGGVKK